MGATRIIDSDGHIMESAEGISAFLPSPYRELAPFSFFDLMALIPLQDPPAAVAELRRAVRELGMRGAMLPATGLPENLGAKAYWPVYEEADRLGCALAIHGGCHDGLGMDNLNVFPAVH